MNWNSTSNPCQTTKSSSNTPKIKYSHFCDDWWTMIDWSVLIVGRVWIKHLCENTHLTLHIDDEYDELCFLINSPFVLLYEWGFDECVEWGRVKCWEWLRDNTKCDWENQDVFWWEWYFGVMFWEGHEHPTQSFPLIKFIYENVVFWFEMFEKHTILLKFDCLKTKTHEGKDSKFSSPKMTCFSQRFKNHDLFPQLSLSFCITESPILFPL